MSLADDLLARIGLTRARADLQTVHRAYLARIPYEDLAVQLGECGPLDLDALAARVLHGGRGGYCFELNTLLAALLRELGFTVHLHEAVVGAPGARAAGELANHLALVVEAGGELWFADAGFGEGAVEALPLREGTHRVGPLAWTFSREADGGWWLAQHEWGSVPGISIAPAEVTLDAFAPHHRRLSTSPESSFVQTLVVQRPEPDRIVTLRARTLSEKGPDADAKRVVADAEDLAAALGAFGIDAGVLGPERMERLWTLACAQHEAWQARAA